MSKDYQKKKRNKKPTKDSKKDAQNFTKDNDSRRTKNSKEDESATYGDRQSYNDASWYIPDEKIRNQVGSFAVNTVTGVPTYLEMEDSETAVLTKNQKVEVVYGSVMEIRMFPYPGTGTGLIDYLPGISALDTACRKLYSAISSVNSKTTQYTPESLGIAIIAVGELVSLISFAKRLYGVAFTYNPRNRRIPKQVIEAMGISTSILNDLAKYRMDLNKLITAANNIRMLSDIKYFTKCNALYSDYFEDSQSGLAQFYVPRPAGYLKYVETDPTHGELQWVDFGEQIDHITFLHHLETCLNSLLTSSLMNFVYTDIVNYITKEGGSLIGFSYVGELYAVLPIYDQTFLTQVHNMSWDMYNLDDYRIYEDTEDLLIKTSNIISVGESAVQRCANTGSKLLDFPFTDNPSVDDKIDAVMFKTIIWAVDDEEHVTGFAAPDHPVSVVRIHKSDGTREYLRYIAAAGGGPNFTNEYAVVGFQIRPIVYYTWEAADYIKLYPFGDFNYFTTLTYKQLKNIYDFSFLGLFDASVKDIKPF